ncbi:hypothetical protein HY338_04185 [Candidatus Gottesmanbacteria bacterium]|nr:hypothetical protein [Candidatus Gottesmanbacteria bacterium]
MTEYVLPAFQVDTRERDFSLDETLDRLIENDGQRMLLASQIDTAKTELFADIALNPLPKDYPELAMDLSAKAKTQASTYKKERTRKSFIDTCASLTALSEAVLFDPSDLEHAQDLQKRRRIVKTGIQPSQIADALAVFTMHSDQIPSGDGKSRFIIPLAVAIHALVSEGQVHLIVRDQEIKARDAENLQRLASPLGLKIGILKDRSERIARNNDMARMVGLRDLLNHTASVSVDTRRKYQKRLQGEIDRIASDINYRAYFDADTGEELTANVLIGDDMDFAFASMGDESEHIWSKGDEKAICDEGDLFITRGSPYIIEKTGYNPLNYLPVWIASSVTHQVCSEMRDEGLITLDNGSWSFYDEDGNDTDEILNSRIKEAWEKLQQSGQLPDDFQTALNQSLTDLVKSNPTQFHKGVHLTEVELRALVKHYTKPEFFQWENYETVEGEIVKTDLYGSYGFAFCQAQSVTGGQMYSRSGQFVTVIDQDTGHPLPTHKFQGLLDLAIDAKEGVCRLKARSDESEDSTGFHNFLASKYGKGKFAFVSGTLDHVEGDIRLLGGKNFIHSKSWMGIIPEPPAYSFDRNFDGAFRRLELLMAGASGRPVELICADDEEIDLLSRLIGEKYPEYQVQTVTSQTSRSDERIVFKNAGDKNVFTLANPRGGRAIDVKTTDEADEVGGLLLVVWGGLANKAVLRQVLARTARAGHPGEVKWLVYGDGGKLGLSENNTVRRFPELQRDLEKVSEGEALSYDFSLVEKIHDKNDLEAQRERLLAFAYDQFAYEVMSETADLVREEFKSKPFPNGVASEQYVEEFFRRGFRPAVGRMAERYLMQLGRFPIYTVQDFVQARVVTQAGNMMNTEKKVFLQIARLSARKERMELERLLFQMYQYRDIASKFDDKIKLVTGFRRTPFFARNIAVISPTETKVVSINDPAVTDYANAAVYLRSDPHHFYIFERKNRRNHTAEYNHDLLETDSEGRVERKKNLSLVIDNRPHLKGSSLKRSLRAERKWIRFMKRILTVEDSDVSDSILRNFDSRGFFTGRVGI